ncbi:DUF5994 family protein [Amycolatopsis sp. FDAARGOS 1241]|uniref:DUF5994 family protein n=1 Tax=Amycolatopsis sp. FDAARGOS 1241 TaxID=2778070 RepID=UPI00351CB59C
MRLKPPLSVAGFVDGAWWPRSTELTAEVPELAAALAERIGPVWRVAFASPTWTTTGAKLVHRGRVVRLEGFPSQDPHVVHVTGSLLRRLTLLVIRSRTTQASPSARCRQPRPERSSAPGDDPRRSRRRPPAGRQRRPPLGLRRRLHRCDHGLVTSLT